MLAALDDDDDDPFLTSDDDEDGFETNELTVEDTDWLHLLTFKKHKLFTVRNENIRFTCVGVAFQIVLLSVIVLALV